MTSTIKSKDKTETEVYKLKLKGETPVLAQPKPRPSVHVAAAQNAVPKGPPCEIENSLKTRLDEGAINSTVTNKDKEKEDVWQLRQEGEKPSLQRKTEVQQTKPVIENPLVAQPPVVKQEVENPLAGPSVVKGEVMDDEKSSDTSEEKQSE